MSERHEPPAEAQSSPPSIADGRERRLDPRAVQAARMTGGIVVTVLAMATLLALAISLLTAAPGRYVVLGLVAAWFLFVGAIVARALLWPPVWHRHVSYRVDSRGIRIRRGVIWRSEVTVPRSRVQHTDVSRGPVERGFGLATLIVHTAGTEHAAVSLGGLAAETANEIRNFLIEGGEDDAV